jgi:hypothetical protein
LFHLTINCDFATRFALSGELLFAARQKEPKALIKAAVDVSASGMRDQHSVLGPWPG